MNQNWSNTKLLVITRLMAMQLCICRVVSLYSTIVVLQCRRLQHVVHKQDHKLCTAPTLMIHDEKWDTVNTDMSWTTKSANPYTFAWWLYQSKYNFVETQRKFTIEKLSTHKLGPSLVNYYCTKLHFEQNQLPVIPRIWDRQFILRQTCLSKHCKMYMYIIGLHAACLE